MKKMTMSPRGKERLEATQQLGCFPRNGDKFRNSPGSSRENGDGDALRKTAKDVFDEKERELVEIRSYWQEEYKVKVGEVSNLEAALKEAVESRNTEVEELRMYYENTIRVQNSEISELRRTLDELMATKEEILASAEKSTESRLRAKDAEVMRLRIWLEEAKKSNAQGREVLHSYQGRLRDKEMQIEELKESNGETVKALEQELEKLKAILSEIIEEKYEDNESSKRTLDSVIKEKEKQMDMIKESSNNVITIKVEENERKEKDIQRLQAELSGKEAEVVMLRDAVTKLQSTIAEHKNERKKLREALRSASESRNIEMDVVHKCQQQLIEQKGKQLISTEMLIKEKDRRIGELSAKVGLIEAQLASELSQKRNDREINSDTPLMMKKMNELNEKQVLSDDARAKEYKISDLQKRLKIESQEKELLQQECDSLNQDLDNWRCAMKLIEEERNSLENEVKRVVSELEGKSSACCELESKLQSLESVRKNLEDVIGQLRKENADSCQGKKSLEFVIRERDQENNMLKEKLNISERKFALEMEHRAVKERNNVDMIEDLEKRFEETQDENEKLKINLDEREKDVANLSSLLEDAKEQEHKLVAELDQLSEELEILKVKYGQGNADKEALERSLTNSVSLKQKDLETLQEQFEKSSKGWQKELEKRDQCWKEALRAKDNLLKDVKASFDETAKCKEEEIKELQKSLQEAKVEFCSVKEALEKRLKLREEEIYFLEKTFEGSLREKEEKLAGILTDNEDILEKSDEKEKEMEKSKAEMDKLTELMRLNEQELTENKQRMAELEVKLREKEELLENAETENRELHSHLNIEEENHVVEIKNVIQSAEEGFRERENVAERMKAIIQENAVKYRLAARKKDDTILGLKSMLESLEKDTADMRVNLATIIQETSDNEAKLKHDLKILGNEKMSLESRLSELTKSLERRDEELKLHEDEQQRVLDALTRERLSLKESQENYLSLKREAEQKEQTLRQTTEKCEELGRELEDFNQVKSLLQSTEREKTLAEEGKQDLIQELHMLKRKSDAKDGQNSILLQKVKMLKKNHFETAQKQEKLEENVVTLQIKLNERETEINELEKYQANAEEESTRQLELLEEIRLRKDEVEEQMKELKELVNAQKVEIEGAKQREDELKQAIQELMRSLEENELNTIALVSNVKEGKAENERICSEYDNFKTSALTKQDRMQKELDHLHTKLDRHEELLVLLKNEKENLISELGKARQADDNSRATFEYYVVNLKGENESLSQNIASLNEELKVRVAEISELNAALTSTNVSKEFLMQEIKNLKVSSSAKDASLCEAHKSLEAIQKEENSLKHEVKSLEARLNREISEKNNLIQNFEEVKSTTIQLKQKMDDVLLEKENMIKSLEKMILRIKQENEILKARLMKCDAELKADKKCVAGLLEKRHEMSAQIESLRKDKEILSVSLKDMDMLPVKLKTTQESLCKTKDLLKVLKEELKEKTEERNYLSKTVRDLASTNGELKEKLEVQTTVKEAELALIRKQLDDKNKEFYDLKVANTAQEMGLRDALFKIKDLESSLKNEAGFHQSIALSFSGIKLAVKYFETLKTQY
ncbi:centromere-associated protein E-like [Stylophora pistillata]|uniref:centromere-associated protein E-like n=1 Tax=Stylophora pistillata TaxID=50429 RepID=UPI000C03CEE0|nr:centromere-associated protein E-like [Stylophora pistillata]